MFNLINSSLRRLQNLSLQGDKSNKGAYPIATLTWVLAYETGNGEKASSIKDVLNYMLSDSSQDKAPSLGFVPLKGEILKASKTAVNKIEQ